MKRIATIITAVILLSNCIAQDNESKDGFYQTYEDYLKGNVKYEGEIEFVGKTINAAPNKVHFEDNKKKSHKIKGSPYWGCVDDGISYRFYKNEPLQIICDGKIKLYSTGPFDIIRNEEGLITNVLMTLGSGSEKKKLFLHKGNDLPKRMTSQSMAGEFLADDKETLAQFNKGKAVSSGAIFLNVIESVQRYNLRAADQSKEQSGKASGSRQNSQNVSKKNTDLTADKGENSTNTNIIAPELKTKFLKTFDATLLETPMNVFEVRYTKSSGATKLLHYISFEGSNKAYWLNSKHLGNYFSTVPEAYNIFNKGRSRMKTGAYIGWSGLALMITSAVFLTIGNKPVAISFAGTGLIGIITGKVYSSTGSRFVVDAVPVYNDGLEK